MSNAPMCPACGLAAIPRNEKSPRCKCSWRKIARAYHDKGQEDLAAIAATMADRELGLRLGDSTGEGTKP